MKKKFCAPKTRLSVGIYNKIFNCCSSSSKPVMCVYCEFYVITIVASHLDTLNTKIGLIFHILDTEIGWCEKKWEAGVGGGGKHFYRIG